MPRGRPAASGYARIAQAEEEEDPDYTDDENHASRAQRTVSETHYAPIQPGHRTDINGDYVSNTKRHRGFRKRANSGVDIKALNARLEKWAEEIAAKFKFRRIKGKTDEDEQLDIHYSVFTPADEYRPATADTLSSQFRESADRMTKMQFDDTIESVRVAIELGTHPKMIAKGSSGSYFARNTAGTVVGVFKPKDEEPYASRNPKWTKWIHRNLFPFAFGRACLIPNLSYISEAAAYVLDTRLQTNIVPYTDVVYFSSPAFHYDYFERRAYYRRRKPLPQKAGSFQVFLKGFSDASDFLKKHPWPDQSTTNLRAAADDRRRKRRRWAEECRIGSVPSDDEDEVVHGNGRPTSRQRREFWSDELQQSFREELEKLVILDYIMRNTDRGLDNWMIRIDQETGKASIVAEPPHSQDVGSEAGSRSRSQDPYSRAHPMMMNGSAGEESFSKAKLGAIDNSLSWPWKHPDAWRSYPFGWLFLPVSLIGKPFSDRTRAHFLPLLTSKQWWSDTQVALRKIFSQDSDFQERMFARQIAVMKGQAWNVVETLKEKDHGPLELTRRARVCVWDDIVEIPVAIPMRSASQERRQRYDQGLAHAAEAGDLSASRVPTLSQANGYLPNPRRFDLSPSPNRVGSWQDAASTLRDGLSVDRLRPSSRTERRPSRVSLDESRPKRLTRDDRKRNLSFSVRRMSDYEHDDDDDDGDLGFAMARDMEGHRRKVIVERLEMVKSKAPFFTWC